ncbi:MAG TPA: 23S rRNA (pseudouridine(1915)-N(3))-methyltransferase RlmH [Candidatus Deferrimicrobium sp.]|nr:23S rRNA (pseudouridine(1915)-N(3))-methyltransferase RlmH [Candidatus Deferrimicrobium sp.]
MQIRIVAVGKLKEKYWQAGVEEYQKRLRVYTKLELIEVEEERCPETLSPAQELQVKDREGDKIIKAILPGSFVIALNLTGKEYSSEQFADFIADLSLKGRSQFTFIIGGSLGLSEGVLAKADLHLVFSRFTFPRQLIRVVLLEQIYRAFRIIRHEPYHK